MQRHSPLLLSLALLMTLTAAGLVPRSARAAKCPNLLLVLDKSGSMTDGPSGGSAPPGEQKWDYAKKAVTALLERYDGQLPIGLSLFAGDNSCAAGKIDIPPAYDTKMQILQRINSIEPDSATPTSETIENLRTQPVLKDGSRAQYMLLLTDGEPTCASGEPGASVSAVESARKQNPAITTFVVGFGALPASAASAMDQMAEVGGKPVVGEAHKFYQAESPESLNAALDKIFQIVIGESVMGCDDSCYAPDVGCPNPGDMCIRAQCKPNPCAGVTCGPGLYCYSDGVQPGRCIGACTKRCPNGQRCELGRCISDPCPAPCIPGFVCNAGARRCELDPLCEGERPRKDQCKPPSQCQYGTCVDDPCRFIKCPKDTRCVAWNGSCEYVGDSAAPADMGPSVDTDDVQHRGCAAGSSQVASGSSFFAGLVLLCVLWSRQRRRR